jgi:hypothetical protein
MEAKVHSQQTLLADLRESANSLLAIGHPLQRVDNMMMLSLREEEAAQSAEKVQLISVVYVLSDSSA